MKLKFCNIDPSTSSPEEIKKEIERLTHFMNNCHSEEMAYKLAINSIYGGLANKYFVAFNTDVAEAVTLQGQDLIKYAEKILNRYFNNFWHTDTELHEKLGITTKVRQVTTPLVIYSDTDSNYVAFEEVIKSCDWEGDPIEFVIKISEFRLADYLDTCFLKYAEKYKTKNYQDFELETISYSGHWLAKKKYLLNLAWKLTKATKLDTGDYKYDGISFKSLSKITSKGIELVQSSTPAFAREKIKIFVDFLFTKKKTIQLREVVNLLKTYKQEFKLQEPERISQGSSVNNYEQYILNDSTEFETASGCPMQVRAAGYYNYLLNKNNKHKGKYEMVKSGDKIKFYIAKSKKKGEENNVFGYLPNSYPVEFAPDIDYDAQFSKCIIDPINRLTQVMGHQQLNSNLFISNVVISFAKKKV